MKGLCVGAVVAVLFFNVVAGVNGQQPIFSSASCNAEEGETSTIGNGIVRHSNIFTGGLHLFTPPGDNMAVVKFLFEGDSRAEFLKIELEFVGQGRLSVIDIENSKPDEVLSISYNLAGDEGREFYLSSASRYVNSDGWVEVHITTTDGQQLDVGKITVEALSGEVPVKIIKTYKYEYHVPVEKKTIFHYYYRGPYYVNREYPHSYVVYDGWWQTPTYVSWRVIYEPRYRHHTHTYYYCERPHTPQTVKIISCDNSKGYYGNDDRNNSQPRGNDYNASPSMKVRSTMDRGRQNRSESVAPKTGVREYNQQTGGSSLAGRVRVSRSSEESNVVNSEIEPVKRFKTDRSVSASRGTGRAPQGAESISSSGPTRIKMRRSDLGVVRQAAPAEVKQSAIRSESRSKTRRVESQAPQARVQTEYRQPMSQSQPRPAPARIERSSEQVKTRQVAPQQPQPKQASVQTQNRSSSSSSLITDDEEQHRKRRR